MQILCWGAIVEGQKKSPRDSWAAGLCVGWISGSTKVQHAARATTEAEGADGLERLRDHMN